MTFSPANDDAPPTPDEVFCNLVGRGDLAGMMATPALHQRVQGRDAEGWTPLHWAALYGHAECAGFLIAFGADVDARTQRGETPLMIAAESRHKNVMAVLLDAQADAAPARDTGERAMDILRAQNAPELAAWLRDALAERAAVLQKPLPVMPPVAVRKRGL